MVLQESEGSVEGGVLPGLDGGLAGRLGLEEELRGGQSGQQLHGDRQLLREGAHRLERRRSDRRGRARKGQGSPPKI